MQWLSRRAAPPASPARVHARDSLSIVLAPPLLATRTDEPAARCLVGKPPPQRQFAGRGRGTWPLWVTRRQLLYGRSSLGGGRTASRRAEPGRACTGSPRKNPTCRNWSARLQARRAAPFCTEVRHSPATMPHPFRCVMIITITCIGTDAALPCPEPLFEKPPWMKISSRTLRAVRSGCWPTGCGSDTQAAARRWQATSAKPTRHLQRPGRLSASPSCRRIRHCRSDPRPVRVNDSPRFFRKPTAPRATRGAPPPRRCLTPTGNGRRPEPETKAPRSGGRARPAPNASRLRRSAPTCENRGTHHSVPTS